MIIANLDKFFKFWGGVWERGDHTPNMPWTEKIWEELKKKLLVAWKSLTSNSNGLISEIKKRKNLTEPVDEFKIFGEKVLDQHKSIKKKTFEWIRDGDRLIPTWWLLRRTILIPKSKDLSYKGNYHPSTYLNRSYKLLTGLVGKFMRNYAISA